MCCRKDGDRNEETTTGTVASTGRTTRTQAGVVIKPSKQFADMMEATASTTTQASSKREKSSTEKTQQGTKSALLAAKAKTEDLRVWVSCDKCGKWRALPSTNEHIYRV